MNQESMTFGQAVDWIGEDKSRVVQSNTGVNFLRFNKKEERFEASTDAKEWVADNNMSLNFGILWRPYIAPKPKSVIEEAIEREAKSYWVGRGCDNPEVTELCKNMARVANVALDEAKKAKEQWMASHDDKSFAEAIDTLKVKL